MNSSSVKLILYSIDFEEFKLIQEQNDWDELERMMTSIARKLESAGADCIIMCTNTPHLVADKVKLQINIPLLHIAEETGREIQLYKLDKVGLIGTKFTMENSFFKDRLSTFGIESIIPETSDREIIHLSIFIELTKGVFLKETKQAYQEIKTKLQHNGAQGIIFGCTEISFLLTQEDSALKIFDTTAIHSKSAVDFALS